MPSLSGRARARIQVGQLRALTLVHRPLPSSPPRAGRRRGAVLGRGGGRGRAGRERALRSGLRADAVRALQRRCLPRGATPRRPTNTHLQLIHTEDDFANRFGRNQNSQKFSRLRNRWRGAQQGFYGRKGQSASFVNTDFSGAWSVWPSALPTCLRGITKCQALGGTLLGGPVGRQSSRGGRHPPPPRPPPRPRRNEHTQTPRALDGGRAVGPGGASPPLPAQQGGTPGSGSL